MTHRAALLFGLVALAVSPAAAATPGVVSEGPSAAVEPEVVMTYWLTDGGYDYRVLVDGTAVNGEALRVGATEGQDIVGSKNGADFGWSTVERNRYHGVAGTDYHLLSRVGPLPLNFVWTNNIGGASGVGQLWLTQDMGWLHESFNDYVADGWGWGSGTWATTPSSLPNSRNSVVYETTGAAGWNDVYYARRTYSDCGAEVSFKRGPADNGGEAMYLMLRTDGTQNNGVGVGIVAEGSSTAMYAVFKWVGGVPVNLIPWTATPNLITGADVDGDGVLDGPVWNTIKVVATGDQYDIYLNHLYETTFFDGEFLSGFVGLRVYYSPATDVVEADNVTVDPYAYPVPVSQIIVAPADAADGAEATGTR